MDDFEAQQSEPASADSLRPGDVLAGKYKVDRIIGAGGMGMVVQATHIALQDRVALKFLLPEFVGNESLCARFLREAQAAVRIKSPHVARVVDVGTLESGAPYMVMEYLEGHDLGNEVERHGPYNVEQCALWMLQACEALAAAHAAGVVHRDIKSANLFVTHGPDGSSIIKVLDFGISKVSNTTGVSSLTRTHTAMGSPMYMSPEQMRSARDVDARADIWSLGVVMFEVLTGKLPFVAESMPQLVALVLESPAPSIRAERPDLPERMNAIVTKCLQKSLADRYQTIAELAADLAGFAGSQGIESAKRTARILAGGSTPENAPISEIARNSTAPVQPVTSPDQPSKTSTSFGRTDPTTGASSRTALYAALGGGIAVIALGAAWLAFRGVGQDASPVEPARPEGTRVAAETAVSAPPTTPAPSQSASAPAPPEAASAAPSASEPPATPQPTTPRTPPRVPGTRTPGGGIYDDRQ